MFFTAPIFTKSVPHYVENFQAKRHQKLVTKHRNCR